MLRGQENCYPKDNGGIALTTRDLNLGTSQTAPRPGWWWRKPAKRRLSVCSRSGSDDNEWGKVTAWSNCGHKRLYWAARPREYKHTAARNWHPGRVSKVAAPRRIQCTSSLTAPPASGSTSCTQFPTSTVFSSLLGKTSTSDSCPRWLGRHHRATWSKTCTPSQCGTERGGGGGAGRHKPREDCPGAI